MSDAETALTHAQTTEVGAVDNDALAKLLGLDRSTMEAEQKAAAQLAVSGFGGNRKVDTTGMVSLRYDNMGRFSPTYPGEKEASDRIFRTFTALVIDTRFWPARVLKSEVEKNGKTETKYTTDCELAKFALPEAVPNEAGEYPWVTGEDGKLKGYVQQPEFGLNKTVAGYHMVGSKHGVCVDCPFADKTHPEKCKITGHLTLLVLQENGKDVGLDGTYFGALRPNYSSTIAFKQMMDEARGNPALGNDPTRLLVEIGLEKNAEGTDAYWQFTFRAAGNIDKMAPDAQALISRYLSAAATRFGEDKAKVQVARQTTKAVAAADTAATVQALAEGKPAEGALPF